MRAAAARVQARGPKIEKMGASPFRGEPMCVCVSCEMRLIIEPCHHARPPRLGVGFPPGRTSGERPPFDAAMHGAAYSSNPTVVAERLPQYAPRG